MANPRLTFLGAAGEVTGSCYLLEAGGTRILVDCGLFQGGPDVEALNRAPFDFDPASLTAVILTHAHIDHSGRLPLLVKQGFTGSVHTHKATRDLAKVMLKDSAFLAEREWERQSRRKTRKTRGAREGNGADGPLYSVDDALATISRFSSHAYGEAFSPAQGITVRLHDAGHILGSAIVELTLDMEGLTRRIIFSGDLGHQGAPLLKDPASLNKADVVIMESTYGDRHHRPWDETFDELGGILSAANAEKGNVLIPAFAVGRTQELLYLFGRNFDKWDLGRWEIFLDSPMAIETTEIYARHDALFDTEARDWKKKTGSLFLLPNLHISETRETSMGINQIASGAIIIAGSGMCTGGRIRHHLRNTISKPHTHVMMVGFQARGTTGRALVDGARSLNFWGEAHDVKAKVHTIGGLSAHAGADGLMRWALGFSGPPEFILVHGEPDAQQALAARMNKEARLSPSIPSLGAVYDLAALKWVKRHGANSHGANSHGDGSHGANGKMKQE